MKNSILNIGLRNLAFSLVGFVFLLLLWRNPFSERTLIPNFEPFPDTFHYITTPLCWLNNQGWNICRLNNYALQGVKTSVPAMYSISLIPGFILRDDPRMFYFTNVIFSLTSFSLLYLVLKKIYKTENQKSNFILFANQVKFLLPLFVFITAYHIYWFPTLAMAENLLLVVFILGLFILTLPVSILSISFALIIGLSFVTIKYAALPLTISYCFIYFFKILHKYRTNKKLLGKILVIFFTLLLVVNLFNNFVFINRVFKGFVDIFINRSNNTYFSLQYFTRNFEFYYRTLLGHDTKTLWDFTNLYPLWLGVGALSGYIWAFYKKNELGIITFLLTLSQILFMSLFYDYDARYIIIVIPFAVIGFALYVNMLEKLLAKQKATFILPLVLLFALFIYGFSNFTRIKSQISLNLKYAETPWEMVAVQNFNQFFTDKMSVKPILISASAPFLIDYYSNDNYDLLPLTPHQEFRSQKDQIWGPGDYENYSNLYRSKLEEGKTLYITNYGIGNDEAKKGDLAKILEQFETEQVYSGCHDLCNIYKLVEIKDAQ